MQREDEIPISAVSTLLAAVYEGTPSVCLAYSEYEQDIVCFSVQHELEQYISHELDRGKKFIYVMVHYPDTKGYIHKKKISLKPESCNGATYRYSMEGWGLIQLQIDYKKPNVAICRVAVNTETRALAWAQTIPKLNKPALWDWVAVEKHARRLIRVLRKCA
jgi:hypothetical protein